MPAVHAEPLLAAIQAIRAQDLRQAEVGRAVRAVALAPHVEVPGAAEVVLGAGAADRGELLVAVEVELDLALAPPARAVDAPGEVCADILPGAGHGVEDWVHSPGGKGVAAVKLAVQVPIAGDVDVDLVADLVVDGGGLR